MSLLSRIQANLCAAEGCKRVPAYPGQRYCETHRLPWVPTWRKRLTAKELTA